jgi:transcriptional regulator with XRE-family HTH domain
MKGVGKYFKLKRIDAGLSQNAVARLLKFKSGQFVSNWEREICLPPIASLKKIAEIYKLERDEVISKILDHTRQTILTEWNKK